MAEVTQLEGWLLKRGEGYVDPDDDRADVNANANNNNAAAAGSASAAGTGVSGGTPNSGDDAASFKPGAPRKKRSIYLPETAAQSAEVALALAKAKFNDIRAAGTAEKKRFFKLVSMEPPKDASLGTIMNANSKAKALLKYFSREKCDPSSLKGSIPLNDETEVHLLPNDTVIKLVTPGRTYYLRPEGDRSSALARATAARWVQAIDTEIRRLYVLTTASGKKGSAELARKNSSATTNSARKARGGKFNLLKQDSVMFQQEEEEELPADLESLLKDTKHRKEFHKFCENALGAESMDFMDALDLYDKIKDPVKKNEACAHIIKVFIEQDGEKQVNISAEQRNLVLKLYAKKAARDPPPKNLFEEARFEVFKLLEKNFFKRFLKEMERKTGAFTALFGLFGLDGWNAVVGHFGPVMTDHERTLLGLKVRLERAEAQQKAIEESFKATLAVSSAISSTTSAALRRTYASTNMQIGALALYGDEIRGEVIKPMMDLSTKVKMDLDTIVKSVAEPVNELINIRKNIATANTRVKRAQEIVDSLKWDNASANVEASGVNAMRVAAAKRQSFGAAVKQNVQAALKMAKDFKFDANQQAEEEEPVVSPEEELKLAKTEIAEWEKAQETCEQKMSKYFEGALDKLESLELYRLETTKKILRHAALAEHELYKTMKRVLDEMGNATRKIDAANDVKTTGIFLATPTKPLLV